MLGRNSGELGILGHKPPISLRGPAINLYLLQILAFWYIWPHCAAGTQTLCSVKVTRNTEEKKPNWRMEKSPMFSSQTLQGGG